MLSFLVYINVLIIKPLMTKDNQRPLKNPANAASEPHCNSDGNPNEPAQMQSQSLQSSLSSTLSTGRSSVEDIEEPVEDPSVALDNDLNSRITTGRDTDNHDGLGNNR